MPLETLRDQGVDLYPRGTLKQIWKKRQPLLVHPLLRNLLLDHPVLHRRLCPPFLSVALSTPPSTPTPRLLDLRTNWMPRGQIR